MSGPAEREQNEWGNSNRAVRRCITTSSVMDPILSARRQNFGCVYTHNAATLP